MNKVRNAKKIIWLAVGITLLFVLTYNPEKQQSEPIKLENLTSSDLERRQLDLQKLEKMTSGDFNKLLDRNFPNFTYYTHIKSKDFKDRKAPHSEAKWDTYVDGKKISHPARVAMFGLLYHDLMVRGKGDTEVYRRHFLAAADELVRTQVVIDGAGFWFYDFAWSDGVHQYKPPWISGLAQGQAISLLARAYKQTGNKSYLSAMKRAFKSFRNRPDDNLWFVRQDNGYLWLEEYPNKEDPAHVLNGFIYGFWGVVDYYRATGSAEAFYLVKDFLRTLITYLPHYNISPGWSKYDLRRGFLPQIFLEFVREKEVKKSVKFRQVELEVKYLPGLGNKSLIGRLIDMLISPISKRFSYNCCPYNPYPIETEDVNRFSFYLKAPQKSPGGLLIDKAALYDKKGNSIMTIDIGPGDEKILPAPPRYAYDWGPPTEFNSRGVRRFKTDGPSLALLEFRIPKNKKLPEPMRLKIDYYSEPSVPVSVGVNFSSGIEMGVIQGKGDHSWKNVSFLVPRRNLTRRDNRVYGDFGLVQYDKNGFFTNLNLDGDFHAGYINLDVGDFFRQNRILSANLKIIYDDQPDLAHERVDVYLFNGGRHRIGRLPFGENQKEKTVVFGMPIKPFIIHYAGAYHREHLYQMSSLCRMAPFATFNYFATLWEKQYQKNQTDYITDDRYKLIKSGSPKRK